MRREKTYRVVHRISLRSNDKLVRFVSHEFVLARDVEDVLDARIMFDVDDELWTFRKEQENALSSTVSYERTRTKGRGNFSQIHVRTNHPLKLCIFVPASQSPCIKHQFQAVEFSFLTRSHFCFTGDDTSRPNVGMDPLCRVGGISHTEIAKTSCGAGTLIAAQHARGHTSTSSSLRSGRCRCWPQHKILRKLLQAENHTSALRYTSEVGKTITHLWKHEIDAVDVDIVRSNGQRSATTTNGT